MQISEKIKENAKNVKNRSIEGLFNQDANRMDWLSHQLEGIYFDFSKGQISKSELNDLIALAKALGLEETRAKMFEGSAINFTENRAVLHVALRNPTQEWSAKGENLGATIADATTRASEFAQKIYDGKITAKNGKKFSAILHLGIGGSDLGPRLVYETLKPIGETSPQLRFCANIEPTEFATAISGLDAATTLIVCVSKTFTTIETLTNLKLARDWLQAKIGTEDGAHLVAISAAPQKAQEFGFASDRIFGFEEWVGGRFSLWSAVGLSLEMALGPKLIDQLREGGKMMDNHFANTPIESNLPILAGLIGYWNHTCLDYASRAIIPYSLRLRLLPQFLQQLDMESNGKAIDKDNNPVTSTGPVVWGAEGTNAQHAFFQHLHQSPQITPVEFIIIGDDGLEYKSSTRLTHANALAQSEALMRGKSLQQVKEQMKAQGKSDEEIAKIAPHRVFTGNRPSSTIIIPQLNAFNLGALIAFFEHRVFVEGVLWGINSFDQWGVELGKVIALEIEKDLKDGASNARDVSTTKAIEFLRGFY